MDEHQDVGGTNHISKLSQGLLHDALVDRTIYFELNVNYGVHIGGVLAVNTDK